MSPSIGTLDEGDWATLVDHIRAKKCTPFVGAGASVGHVPSAGELAKRWASDHDYPLTDTDNLSRVSQYLSIHKGYDMFPRDEMTAVIEAADTPDFSARTQPHGLLADLELPLYITTNYDDFMAEAIRQRRRIEPTVDFCRWNNHQVVTSTAAPASRLAEVDDAHPLVYHLHGRWDVAQSLVLTEADYLDFLVQASAKKARFLPPVVKTALASTSLLFVGYRLDDWSFRVLFRSISTAVPTGMDYPSIAIQLPPEDVRQGYEQQAQDFLERYFEKIQAVNKVRVFWGDVTQFSAELRQHWEAAT